MAKAEPRGPLIISTRDLGRAPGSSSQVNRTVPAPVDCGTDVIAIPTNDPIEVDLLLQAVMEGVLVSGTIRGTAYGECVRCLDKVSLPLTLDLQELYVYPERVQAAEDAGDEDEDLRELIDECVDLEPVVRDAVVLALPFQPLCTPDCPGLCPDCGARLADDPGHHHDSIDPRWSALKSFTQDDTRR